MGKKVKVLVIDDEPSVCEALKYILEDNDYKTFTASTGREGLERAARQPFDVIVTDLRLPDMSGLDVLEAVCRDNPNTLVIIITAHGTPEVLAEARRCGAAGALPKPFLPSEILQLITAALKPGQATLESC